MLRLFGGPSERCFAAYEEVAPLAPGARSASGSGSSPRCCSTPPSSAPSWGDRATQVLRRYA